MCNSKKDLPLTTFYDDGSQEHLKCHARESKKEGHSSAQRLEATRECTNKLKDDSSHKKHVARVTNGLEARSKCHWAPHSCHLNKDHRHKNEENGGVLTKLQAILTKFQPTPAPNSKEVDEEAAMKHIQRFFDGRKIWRKH